MGNEKCMTSVPMSGGKMKPVMKDMAPAGAHPQVQAALKQHGPQSSSDKMRESGGRRNGKPAKFVLK